jgi:DNA-binding NarL/FixJ family response regulator
MIKVLLADDQARLNYPDVAVIDISMPVLDGIEATKQIRECCPHTRAIIFSMHTSPEYIHRALQAGVFGYIVKDSVFEDLLPAVYALLIGRRYFSKKIEGIARHYLDQMRE